ncbi:8-amino-7-oxononanoate synthase [Candidatus Moduliflexus flocculans]|uniref:8-amino-7-oxononanoate synthase n=1 Tax=Candidatus Moduliflexus flocculans TaxID=1499966 RepID=A0A0S6VZ60_9BACT|nr:8-amino-7-oxononanoate synthase [Candidatus Moduliflexus flocculans]
MNADIYDTFKQQLEALGARGQLRQLGSIARRDETHADFNGKRYLNLSSNDYLGLGANQALLEEFLRQEHSGDLIDQFGLASSSSRLLTGNAEAYARLETYLAAQYQAEAACVFNSGYHANIGIISALANRHDLILSDKLNHASMMDGLLLAQAKYFRYRHCDYDHLEQLLEQHRAQFQRTFIITESVFSMDGDVADLQRLVELKNRYNALLIVDEAHAVGVFGEHGLGVCEVQGVTQEIDVLICPLGKAPASLGAYAITNRILKEYLVNTMRPLIFTTALPPMCVNWTLFVMQKIAGMQAERRYLQALSQRFRQALIAHGLNTDGDSQIIPVMIGANDAAVRVSERLREQGYLIFAIRPPTVPPNTARLRLSLNAAMRWEQLAPLPEAIAAALHEMALDSTAA